MKIITFLLFIALLNSCDPPPEMNEKYLPTKQALVNEVRNQAFKQLKVQRDLYPFGVGSQMMDQIKMLALAFHYYHEVNIDEARELVIYVATTFLDEINKSEHIRKYLDTYPFKPENIQIEIFLENLDGSKLPPEKLCAITMADGILKYKIDHPDRHKFLIVQEETYEEAVTKIYSSNKSIAM